MKTALTTERLIALIRDNVDHPATLRELAQLLSISTEELSCFKRRIRALVDSGDLIKIRGHHYGVPDRMNLVVGRVETKPRGFGFVIPEGGDDSSSDVFIAGANLNQAMHGDRVVARIEQIKPDGSVEGRIVRILERGASAIVGRFELEEGGVGFVVPFDRRMIMDVQVPEGEAGGAMPGQMVMVDVTRWPSATRGPVGRVTEVLGDIDAPGVDTEIIIRKYGIPDEHPAATTSEARGLGGEVRERDIRGRTDFRALQTVTIDGEHARDFDDAITLERLPSGNYSLGVHIADVSHYVREGSALDKEAYARGTSVYFPERAVHMFPSELSTGLCSLNPHVDRLVQSCVMEIDGRGQVVRHGTHDGVIHSDARMTYTGVNAVLTDRDPEAVAQHDAFVPMLEQMRDLFQILNQRRHRRGSIDFDLKVPEIVLDDEGLVEAIVAAERNIAHRIIEEFMLVANETVAAHLEDRAMPSLYRVHEEPDSLRVDQFDEFLATLGYSLATHGARALRPRHFQRLIERIRGKPEEKPIALLMLRTMQKARYDPANLGHFGLATACYTHFTSPIRRYPDLVVHRTLRALRTDTLDAATLDEFEEQLPEIARHTSEMERRADDAERELVQWKKVRFMVDKVGDEFQGFVTGVTAFGLFVELVEHVVEGLVHISTMADDYYRFVERAHILRGENTQKVFRLGDQVHVQVLKVDLQQRQVDLGLVGILESVRREADGRGRRRSTARPKAERRGNARSAGGRRRSGHGRRGRVRRKGADGDAGSASPRWSCA